jgi:outer membrane protein assembly factor BamB
VNSSPAVAGDYVYVGGWDGYVYCLDEATGIKVWSYATGSYVNSSPAVVDNIVYVGSWDHNIYAFGKLSATTPSASPSIEPSPTILEFPSQAVIIVGAILIVTSLLIGIQVRRQMNKKK